jgi:hypothetical protein
MAGPRADESRRSAPPGRMGLASAEGGAGPRRDATGGVAASSRAGATAPRERRRRARGKEEGGEREEERGRKGLTARDEDRRRRRFGERAGEQGGLGRGGERGLGRGERVTGGARRGRGGGRRNHRAPRAGDAGGCDWAATWAQSGGARGEELGRGVAGPRCEGEGERGKQAARGEQRLGRRPGWAAGRGIGPREGERVFYLFFLF